jgi:2-aminoadipate transaminase
MQKMGSSVIRELLKLTEQPDIISFAGGLPAPEVFPLKEFREACNFVLDNFGPQSLQYSTTEGYLPLREMIARLKPGCDLEVDGGIDATTAPLAVAAGANVLVAGSAVFGAADGVAAAMKRLQAAAQSTRSH